MPCWINLEPMTAMKVEKLHLDSDESCKTWFMTAMKVVENSITEVMKVEKAVS